VPSLACLPGNTVSVYLAWDYEAADLSLGYLVNAADVCHFGNSILLNVV
jgi:hypothetical protein